MIEAHLGEWKKMLIKFVFGARPSAESSEGSSMPYLNGSRGGTMKGKHSIVEWHRKAIEKRHLKCKLDAPSFHFQMALGWAGF